MSEKMFRFHAGNRWSFLRRAYIPLPRSCWWLNTRGLTTVREMFKGDRLLFG